MRRKALQHKSYNLKTLKSSSILCNLMPHLDTFNSCANLNLVVKENFSQYIFRNFLPASSIGKSFVYGDMGQERCIS